MGPRNPRHFPRREPVTDVVWPFAASGCGYSAGAFPLLAGSGPGPIPAALTSSLLLWVPHSCLCLCYILNLAPAQG